MIYQVFNATRDNPVKNYLFFTCEKYLKKLNIVLNFAEIAKMLKFRFNKLLKEIIKRAAFSYLEAQKINKRR